MLVLLIPFFWSTVKPYPPSCSGSLPSLSFPSLSRCLLLRVGWLINAQIGSRQGYGFEGIVCLCVCVSGSTCTWLGLSIWKHPRRRQFKLIMQQSGRMTLWIIMVTSIIHLESLAWFGVWWKTERKWWSEGEGHSLRQNWRKERKKETLWYFMPRQVVLF